MQLIAAASFHALVPLGESQTMRAVGEAGLDYGRVRLWGSLTFIAGNLGAGLLVADFGTHWVLYLILAALMATCLASLTLPADRRPAPDQPAGAGLTSLLGDRKLLAFMLAASLLQASHALYYGFSALHWRAAGHSAATIGWLWAEGAIAEVLLFIAGAIAVRRLGPLGLVALAAAAGLVRWGVLASTENLWGLVPAQALHALTFGAAHLGSIHFIARRAPAGLLATAQSLYAALAGGLALGLGMFAAGVLYEDWGGQAYLAMAGLCAVSLLLIGVLARCPAAPRQSPAR